nr:hypothetical protein [Pistricoccus aurantiacus]
MIKVLCRGFGIACLTP